MKFRLVWPMIVSIALLAAFACGTDEEGAAPTAAAAEPTTAMAAPTQPSAAPTQPSAAPTQPSAAPTQPSAAPTQPSAMVPKLPPVFAVDPTTVVPAGTDLHDTQELRIPNGHGGVAPWRDGGGQRVFSMWVYGTIYQIDKFGAIRPYIGVSHTVSENDTIWTFKLREDAVFQDGTPVTAADFKAYWEHGAKPENIVAWGGGSLTLGDIKGWEEVRAGDITEAEGLTVIDDHTLQIETSISLPTWPLNMAAWHTGISKLDQVLSDEEWFTNPIAAGPYKWTTNPDTKIYVAEADAADFWGPSPTIKKLHGLNVTDSQVQVIMFENGELDLMTIDPPTYEAALNPEHPFNPLLYLAPGGGLWFIKMKLDMAPLEDLLVRKSLGHGADMKSIVKAVWGQTEDQATGLISPQIPCHNPDSTGLQYDPELARQALSTSTYGGPDNLPTLLVDLARPLMVNMGVAVKEYWKDNLGVELDILKRESGMPRREGSQFYRISLGSWIPDPVQIVSNLTRKDSIEALSNIPGGYPVMDALVEHARSLQLDDPTRCAAWNAVEEEYLDKVYMIPIRWGSGRRWVVQPWVVGFESSFNVDINTQPWMYVLAH